MGDSVLVDRSLGLYKVVITTGHGVQCPVEGVTVTVRLQWRDEQDSRKFEIGAGDTVLDEYLDSLLLTMKPGEACSCSLPSSCFTESNSRPGKEVVSVTVHLESMPDRHLPCRLPAPAEHLVSAKNLKDRGGQLVGRSMWWLAARRYSRAVRHSILGLTAKDVAEVLTEELRDVRAKCHLNLAACQLRLGDMARVVKNCGYVLDARPDNVKALFRRACALTAVKEYEQAETDYKHAVQLEPKNRQVQEGYEQLKKLKQKQADYYHNALKSMFGGK